MIEVALLFAYQGCKALFGPVVGRAVANYQQRGADWLVETIDRLGRGDNAPDEGGPPSLLPDGGDIPPSPPPVSEGVTVTDKEIEAALGKHPQQAEELRRAFQDKLGVTLPSPDVELGSEAWFVAAYEAVLWRAACTACWEDRPIAVAGALQGEDWVTVCVPHQPLKAGQVIDPASMWRTSLYGKRLRPRDPSVDFFVRRAKHGQAATEAAKLNNDFIKTGRLVPGSAGPGKEAWHRVDGLNQGWVLLQWDDALREHIQKLRSPYKWEGRYHHPVRLDAEPPKWEECDEQWQLLMDIPNPAAGIKALSDALDDYAAHSQAAKEAVRAALDGGRQG